MHLTKVLGRLITGACCLTLVASGARADTAELNPSKDNSIYSESSGNSNGAGAHLFAGRTSFGALRRSLIAFDIAGNIPAGSTVSSVALQLRCSINPIGNTTLRTFTLHKLSADWGAAASDPGEPGGTGTAAQTGDATWSDRFFQQLQLWSSPGGDFAPAASASFQVGGCNQVNPVVVDVASTAQLVADVQAWLDDPSSNFGWILNGVESSNSTARRFESGDDTDVDQRPKLTVEFSSGMGGDAAGAVPDGDDVPGPPLRLDRLDGGQVELSWGTSCRATDLDYAIYEGQIGDFYSHDSAACGTGGDTSASLVPGVENAYFLVVPVSEGNEQGSYGTASDGTPRPVGGSPCFGQNVADPVCPP